VFFLAGGCWAEPAWPPTYALTMLFLRTTDGFGVSTPCRT